MLKKRVIVMGAAGRDFHNYNVVFRDDPAYHVVAFTATQIPGIEGRVYPPELAGSLYPEGIPIHPEEELFDLIREHQVDVVVFAYSDVPHAYVMDRAAVAASAGADFWLMGPSATQIEARVPVVAVCAVRTGAGKSQTTRKVVELLRAAGKRTVVVRHPMPYGDLAAQAVQRFATYEDLDAAHCTIEEREEYEPHLDRGTVVYAGVDYGAILERAQSEADVILWDGGNNDFPFYRPDLLMVLADPLRAGHELCYWPGSVNTRAAHVIIINKVDSASAEQVTQLRSTIAKVNPEALVIEAASPITVDDPSLIPGRRVLVVEDGPTVTHGDMAFGAGAVAARKLGGELVDPRPYATGSIADVFARYPHLGAILPAMGYGSLQLEELQRTIDKVPCEAIVAGTPIDLRRLVKASVPMTRVRYDLQEIGSPTLEDALKHLL